MDVKRIVRHSIENYDAYCLKILQTFAAKKIYFTCPFSIDQCIHLRKCYSCTIHLEMGGLSSSTQKKKKHQLAVKSLVNAWPIMIGSKLDVAFRYGGLEKISEQVMVRQCVRNILQFEEMRDIPDIGITCFLINGILKQIPFYITNDVTNVHVMKNTARLYRYTNESQGRELNYNADTSLLMLRLTDGTEICPPSDEDLRDFFKCPRANFEGTKKLLQYVYHSNTFEIDHLANKVVFTSGYIFYRMFVKTLYPLIACPKPVWADIQNAFARIVQKSIVNGDFSHVFSKKIIFFKDSQTNQKMSKNVNAEQLRELGANNKVFVERKTSCYREVSFQAYQLIPFLSQTAFFQISEKAKLKSVLSFKDNHVGFLCVCGTSEAKNVGRQVMLARDVLVSACCDDIYEEIKKKIFEEVAEPSCCSSSDNRSSNNRSSNSGNNRSSNSDSNNSGNSDSNNSSSSDNRSSSNNSNNSSSSDSNNSGNSDSNNGSSNNSNDSSSNNSNDSSSNNSNDSSSNNSNDSSSNNSNDSSSNNSNDSSSSSVDSCCYVVVNSAAIPVSRETFSSFDLKAVKRRFGTVECYVENNRFIFINCKSGMLFKKLDNGIYVTPRDRLFWQDRQPLSFPFISSFMLDLIPHYNHNAYPKNVLALNALRNAVLSRDPVYSRYFKETTSSYGCGDDSYHRPVLEPTDKFSEPWVIRLPKLPLMFASYRGLTQEDCIVLVGREDLTCFDTIKSYTIKLRFENLGPKYFWPGNGSSNSSSSSSSSSSSRGKEESFLGTITCRQSELEIQPQSININLEPQSAHCYNLVFQKPGFRVVSFDIYDDVYLFVAIECPYPCQDADKLSSLHGQKGVVRWQEKGFYGVTEDGRTMVPRVLVNPESLIKRQTLGMMKEMAQSGRGQDCVRVFNADDKLLKGTAFVGSAFYFLINYRSREHLYVGNQCVRDKIQGQPVRGRSRYGGMKVGLQEIHNAMRGNGLSACYQEKLLERSSDCMITEEGVSLPKSALVINEDMKYFKVVTDFHQEPSVSYCTPDSS